MPKSYAARLCVAPHKKGYFTAHTPKRYQKKGKFPVGCFGSFGRIMQHLPRRGDRYCKEIEITRQNAGYCTLCANFPKLLHFPPTPSQSGPLLLVAASRCPMLSAVPFIRSPRISRSQVFNFQRSGVALALCAIFALVAFRNAYIPKVQFFKNQQLKQIEKPRQKTIL